MNGELYTKELELAPVWRSDKATRPGITNSRVELGFSAGDKAHCPQLQQTDKDQCRYLTAPKVLSALTV